MGLASRRTRLEPPVMTSFADISEMIASVAGIVAVLSGVVAFFNSLRKPRLRLKQYDPSSTDMVDSGRRPITWSTDVEGEFWIRLRILNSMWRPVAKDVQVSLEVTQVSDATSESKERDVGTKAAPLNLSDGRKLSWADLNKETVDISATIPQRFDLLWGQRYKGGDDYKVHLNFYDKPIDGRDKLFAGYKYDFVLAIKGSNFSPVFHSIRVSLENPVSSTSSVTINVSRRRWWRKRRTPKA